MSSTLLLLHSSHWEESSAGFGSTESDVFVSSKEGVVTVIVFEVEASTDASVTRITVTYGSAGGVFDSSSLHLEEY